MHRIRRLLLTAFLAALIAVGCGDFFVDEDSGSGDGDTGDGDSADGDVSTDPYDVCKHIQNICASLYDNMQYDSLSDCQTEFEAIPKCLRECAARSEDCDEINECGDYESDRFKEFCEDELSTEDGDTASCDGSCNYSTDLPFCVDSDICVCSETGWAYTACFTVCLNLGYSNTVGCGSNPDYSYPVCNCTF